MYVRFLLMVKSEGMSALSQLPDVQASSAIASSTALMPVTKGPRDHPFNNGVFDLSDCGIN